MFLPSSLPRIAHRWLGVDVSYDPLWPTFDLSQVDCAVNGPNIWCASDVVVHWAHWIPRRAFYVVGLSAIAIYYSPIFPSSQVQLSAISTGLGLLPTILLLSYASWTSGPGDRKTSPASVKLVPTALFTSSLGLLLFLPSPSPSDYVAALVPLSLMTCMRGAKDDVGDDDDGWQWNVLVHNTVASM